MNRVVKRTFPPEPSVHLRQRVPVRLCVEQMEERVGVDPTPSTSVFPPPQKRNRQSGASVSDPLLLFKILQHQFAKTGNHHLLTTDVALTLHHSLHTWLVIPSIKTAHHVCDFFAPHIDSLARTGGGDQASWIWKVSSLCGFFLCVCVCRRVVLEKKSQNLFFCPVCSSASFDFSSTLC